MKISFNPKSSNTQIYYTIQFNSTSMACPHVCGLLAALLDKESDPLEGDAAIDAGIVE